MHLRNTDLTDWRAAGIQNFCRNVVTVEFTPACNWFWWAFSITRLVKNCFGGNRYRNFVSSSTGAFWMLPPPHSEEGCSHQGRVEVDVSVVGVWERWISDWKFHSRR